jgi:transcriptional regulator of acetoin/glycerol metabolism
MIFAGWVSGPGTVWSEASVGTNGIGTAIADERAVVIQRDQHFLSCNTGLSCVTAPIRDHLGRVAAAIDISTCRDDAGEMAMLLLSQAVRDAAARIEANLFHRAFNGARILLVPADGKSSPALIAIDRDDLVLGATRAARLKLNLDDRRIASGVPAADLLNEAPVGQGEDLLDAERAALRRVLSRAQWQCVLGGRHFGDQPGDAVPENEETLGQLRPQATARRRLPRCSTFAAFHLSHI